LRVAVLDIGTNSTRLLIADADAASGDVRELDRRSTVTRLGEGVDSTGRLSDEAIGRVRKALDEYRAAIDAAGGVEAMPAVLTSAVRDAANGAEFTELVRATYGFDAKTIPGDEEARLSYLGAAGRRADGGELVVVDIGGGSTELIVGEGASVSFHVSTQAGVVRQTERHIHHDPPQREELDALAAEARATFADSVPEELRAAAEQMIGVAGTATSVGAIDLELEPYDPERVHGHVVTLAATEAIRDRLASMTDAQRREVPGLHPDRAPTIVAGCVLLVEALQMFGLERFEVSEADILHGVALRTAGAEV
jgi:exopolyphosphatase / guanosine-5'-triphosphate,3'-diphosphate pyrophosphatase